MPKSLKEILASIKIDKDIYDVFTKDQLYCKRCYMYLYNITSYSINRHEQNSKHKQYLYRSKLLTNSVCTIDTAKVIMTRKSTFSQELCETF